MPKFRTTKLVRSYDSRDIALFWFVQADKEQRERKESTLNDIMKELTRNEPERGRKWVSGTPWLRNYTPSMADVIDTARGFEIGEGHALGMDAQGMEDGSLLVLHCVCEKTPEIGRAHAKDAIYALLKDDFYNYTLAETFAGRSWTSVPVPVESPEPVIEEDDDQYIIPPHIPSDTKLQEDQITLFSLIKLTDEEISQIKLDMGDSTNEITIHNWPHETPASQAETYNLFQCVKPEFVAGQTFVVFIDAAHVAGPERLPVVVMACKSTPDPSESSCMSNNEKKSYQYNILLYSIEASRVWEEVWPQIFHPQNQGNVNYALLHGGISDVNNPACRYPCHCIAKPGVPVVPYGPIIPAFVVYILCTVTANELRKLRRTILDENRSPVQFIELNLSPRGHDRNRGSNSRTRLDPLLEYFDSTKYRAHADPPETFLFLDDKTLDKILGDETGYDSVPVAHLHCHYTRGIEHELVAEEMPAYMYAEVPIEQGLASTLANVPGNMFFWEVVLQYTDSYGVAFWPEYRGSLTTDMLDIDQSGLQKEEGC